MDELGEALLFKIMLIAGTLVVAACAGGSPEVASAPSDGTIHARGL
jgi:hypothetical protein